MSTAAPSRQAAALRRVDSLTALALRLAALPGLWLVAAVAAGFAVRLRALPTGRYPANDGGMFASMVEDVSANGYRLPEVTTYNQLDIPFAYPPLPFYAGAAMHDITGLSVVGVLHTLPLIVTTATVLAFGFYARSFFRGDRTDAAIAAFAFALQPFAFAWPLMGGGLTRSFGMLFAVIALHQTYLALRDGSRRHALLAGAFAGLCILSHTELAWFLCYSLALHVAVFARSRRALVDSLLIASVACLIALPYWAAVIDRHGLDPFLNAGASRPVLSRAFAWRIIDANLSGVTLALPVIGLLGLAGAVSALLEKKPLLLLWLASTVLLSSWVVGNLPSIALALGTAIGARQLWRLLATTPAGRPDQSDAGWWPPARSLLRACVVVAICLYALWGSRPPSELTTAISPGEEAAMRWARDDSPPESVFLVVENRPWYLARVSEWFPYVSKRASPATVQGREWLDSWADSKSTFSGLQRCNIEDAACIEEWARGHSLAFTHVFVSKEANRAVVSRRDEDCCHHLRDSLTASTAYRIAYDSPAATIFERRSPFLP